MFPLSRLTLCNGHREGERNHTGVDLSAHVNTCAMAIERVSVISVGPMGPIGHGEGEWALVSTNVWVLFSVCFLGSPQTRRSGLYKGNRSLSLCAGFAHFAGFRYNGKAPTARIPASA